MKKVSWGRVTVLVICIISIILMIIAVARFAHVPLLPSFLCENYGYESRYITRTTRWYCPIGCAVSDRSRCGEGKFCNVTLPKCVGW